MPGAYEPLSSALHAMREEGINEIVCLAPPSEIDDLAPAYHQLLKAGPPWPVVHEPVEDFGAPSDDISFDSLVREIAGKLLAGRHILMHCGAGIGRTGTLAAAVLCSLGLDLDDSLEAVRTAGSDPETDEQRALLRRRCATLQLRARRQH